MGHLKRRRTGSRERTDTARQREREHFQVCSSKHHESKVMTETKQNILHPCTHKISPSPGFDLGSTSGNHENRLVLRLKQKQKQTKKAATANIQRGGGGGGMWKPRLKKKRKCFSGSAKRQVVSFHLSLFSPTNNSVGLLLLKTAKSVPFEPLHILI